MSEALIERLVEFAESGNQQKSFSMEPVIKAGSWRLPKMHC